MSVAAAQLLKLPPDATPHDDLRRVSRVWGLSDSDVAQMFHVSRQAVSKWLAGGVPAGRLGAVADLAAATDVLVRHLKPERIPAVVRRRSERLQGSSLVELARAGRTREVLSACRAMFRFGDAHR